MRAYAFGAVVGMIVWALMVGLSLKVGEEISTSVGLAAMSLVIAFGLRVVVEVIVQLWPVPARHRDRRAVWLPPR